MLTKVSVVIPAYNCENYIERCINSLFSQRCDLEIIVVNDGSTDKTLEKLLVYGDRIRVINKSNGGVAKARNLGIKEATGEFVAFCDADDYYREGSFLRLIEEQKRTGADIVRAGYKTFYDTGEEKLPKNRIKKDEFILKEDFKRAIYPQFIKGIGLSSVWGTLYRRDIVKDIEFRSDMRTAEDAVFNLNAYTRANSVSLMVEPCYMYYQNSQGLTGAGLHLKEKYRCNFVLMRETLKRLDEWGMNTPFWKIRTLIRPLILTADKVLRMLGR